MSNHSTRLAKLETQASPVPTRRIVFGFLDKEVDANDEVVTLLDQRFERQPGEFGCDVRKRAIATLGPFDDVRWIAWGKVQVAPTSGTASSPSAVPG